MKKILFMKVILLFIPLLFTFSSAYPITSAYPISIEEILVQKRVSITAQKQQLSKIFKEIESQTKLTFFFSNNCVDVTKTASINAQDETLDVVLNTLLGNNYSYVLKDNYIVVNENRVQQQQPQTSTRKKVEGTVTNFKGEPVIGVNILLKGTRFGTYSDQYGRFTLEFPESPDMVILFSCIGMSRVEIKYTGQESLKVVMEEAIASINDVVVVGYFEANKKTYTGSATTITAEDIAKISSGNILQTIQVLDPSFRIIENVDQGSNPNALPEIELRGSGSLPGLKSEFQYSPNMPTFILDGFEVSAQKIFDLDPSRVLSITLLKDAAATAIYGSRAANGIVVVETKTPSRGRIQINYKGDFKTSSADLTGYDLLNASEKLDYELLAGVYPGANRVSDMERNMDEYYQKLRLVAMGYNTDWLVQPIDPFSIAHKHSLQVEEGGENFRYNLNMFYDKDNGVMKESSRDRLGIGVYFQYRYKNLLFMNNLTYNNVVAKNSPYGSFYEYARVNPYLPYKDINGNVVKFFEYVNTPNPLYNANIGVIDQEAYDEIINNFKLEWRIADGIKLKNTVAFSKKVSNNKLFYPADHTSFRDLYNSQIGSEKDKAGIYRNEYGEGVSFNANSVFSYFKEIKDHYVTFNGGVEVITQRGDLNVFQTRGFPNSLLAYPSFGTSYDMVSTGSGGIKPGGSEDILRSAGFFGTFNYSWKNKYFVDFSGRADGSSKFGANNRWAKLWSAGIGWNIHYEDFLKDSKVITMLRLRASTGFTGSQNYNPNQSLTMFDYIRNYYYQRNYAGAQLTAMGNENLKWQRTRKNNIGMDLELFSKRITATFDYYIDDSKDALTQVTLPPSLGFSSYTENLGQVRNSGYEIKLNIGIVSNNSEGMFWSLFGSAAHNKNTLLKISNSLDAWNTQQDAIVNSKPKVRFIEGQDMKSIWVVPSMGIDPATGSEVFQKLNGEYTTTWNAADQIVGGTLTPDLFGNLGTQFIYKQWQLNLYLIYSLGGETYNQTLVDRVENADPNFNVDRRVFEGRWKVPGDISRFKNISDLSITKPTSRFIEADNYIRLNSVNVSYEFEKRQLERLKLQRLKIIFYANEVFNISTVKQERGLSYPFARSFTLTFQIGI
ncbi:MAG: SusC/RagA family TonB-linked outer membrane protein [Bacteroidetes bacterium HGW-Bacteroidetes-8]|jgi:TonB-linked SusC/RagA family outer membrane protein|nr:MAG: SusC/RagA family TonB-linked outer membrane protein [Bacteroidetes bacterium HGW-Bacteroidetes-8]